MVIFCNNSFAIENLCVVGILTDNLINFQGYAYPAKFLERQNITRVTHYSLPANYSEYYAIHFKLHYILQKIVFA